MPKQHRINVKKVAKKKNGNGKGEIAPSQYMTIYSAVQYKQRWKRWAPRMPTSATIWARQGIEETIWKYGESDWKDNGITE